MALQPNVPNFDVTDTTTKSDISAALASLNNGEVQLFDKGTEPTLTVAKAETYYEAYRQEQDNAFVNTADLNEAVVEIATFFGISN